MIRTILVPLDGSTLAERALTEACRLARLEDAVMVLVRVVPYKPHLPISSTIPDVAVAEAEEYLGRIARRLSVTGLSVRTDLFVSDPAEAIGLAALVHGADVIVMSTHGRSGLDRVILGSVAEKVLHESGVPVMLVRGDRAADALYRRILIPLDGTRAAEDALRYVAEQRFAHEAEVLPVHGEQVAPLAAAAGMWGYVSLYEVEQAEAELQRRCDGARDYLEKVSRMFAARAHPYVMVGDPAAVILQMARDQDVDLIVMATHARHGLDGTIHSSVARHVLRHATVPVLVLRRSDATGSALLDLDRNTAVGADAVSH